jgi:ATP-dependent Clp protease ATP-binding subunit ClpC
MDWQVIVAIVTGVCGVAAAILTVRNKWIQGKVLARKAELANTAPPGEGSDEKDWKDCTRDLTELARQGKFDPPIAHNRELEQIIQVLTRQTRDNPVLVGATGVGKSKLVEGIANVVAVEAEGVVAQVLGDCRILAIDLTRLRTKLSDRTDLEKCLQVVFKTYGSTPPVILVLEDLHILLQLGVSLAPWLNRGRLRCLGTTTPEKYRECLEKYPELERYFQPVTINEPTVDETILILMFDRDRKEAHHRVMINDDALSAAALLSQRYVKEGSLPAKAIELLDETAARVRLNAVARSRPDLKDIDGEIGQLNMEKEQAVAEQDFEKAAHLRDQADKVRKKKEPILRKWREQSQGADGIVDEKEICETLALTTGIPAEQLRESIPEVHRTHARWLLTGIPAEQLKESIHHPPPATLPG